MSTKLKRVERLLRLPDYMRYADVDRVLADIGWRLVSVKGAHFRYEKEGFFDLIVVVHDKNVERRYLKRIIDHTELEEWYELNK